MKFRIFVCLFICLFLQLVCYSQNETNNWYFGNKAGLNFSTNPPTVLISGSMFASEGCASVSDHAGNLLFYTKGDSVWNKSHALMANGFGLLGNNSPFQPCIIAQQPGQASIYYIFTVQGMAGAAGLNYSVVDMSLAAGMGSITSKNAPLYSAPCTEQLAGTMHCNGQNVWIICHETNSNNFRAYLLTNTGISSSPVISAVGSIYPTFISGIKISPTGKKLACTFPYLFNSSSIELFNFDNVTGSVSNATNPLSGAYAVSGVFATGCEFSSDGSKFYAVKAVNGPVFQWDLCAGSDSAIAASQYTTPASGSLGTMQLASNGKIYVGRYGQYLGVINSPNLGGASCNYADSGLSVAPRIGSGGLPNFIGTRLKELPAAFTFTIDTINCLNGSFLAPSGLSLNSTCSAKGPSVSSISWLFGDPQSGSSNQSTLLNPSHTFSGSGNYLVKLILHRSCNADTLYQLVTIPTTPSLTVVGSLSICKGQSTTLNLSGASTYSWNSTTLTSQSITVSPSVTTLYTLTGVTSGNSCVSKRNVIVSVSPCISISKNSMDNSEIKVYPNPFTEFLFVECKEPFDLKIYSNLGTRTIEQSLKIGENKIDLSNLLPGMYFVKLSNNSRNECLQIIKL